MPLQAEAGTLQKIYRCFIFRIHDLGYPMNLLFIKKERQDSKQDFFCITLFLFQVRNGDTDLGQPGIVCIKFDGAIADQSPRSFVSNGILYPFARFAEALA